MRYTAVVTDAAGHRMEFLNVVADELLWDVFNDTTLEVEYDPKSKRNPDPKDWVVIRVVETTVRKTVVFPKRILILSDDTRVEVPEGSLITFGPGRIDAIEKNRQREAGGQHGRRVNEDTNRNEHL